MIILIKVMSIGGIRGGDFKESTRPINLVDANRHVTQIKQADFVLNTPFAFIRTLFKNTFKKVNYKVSKDEIKSLIPISLLKAPEYSLPKLSVIITIIFGVDFWLISYCLIG